MMISFSLLVNGLRNGASVPVGCAPGGVRGLILACEAMRIFSAIRSVYSSMPL